MAHSKSGFILILTKYAGLKGTIGLINKNRCELEKRFSDPFLDSVLNLEKLLSDRRDMNLAESFSGIDIFEPGKNGIFADLWDFAKETGLGLEADIRKIPLRQETIEISNHLDVNPYEISSEGTLLLAAKKEDAEKLQQEFKSVGINSDRIGVFSEGNERVLINRGAKRFLTPVSRIEDEIKLRKAQKKEKYY